MSDWKKVAESCAGSEACPGDQYHITEAELFQRGDRFRVVVKEDWGANQGYLQSNGGHETEGRGNSPEEAVEACRRDVFAWADDDRERADLATMLRQLLYDAEDDHENWGDDDSDDE